ncbi:unnamed protein product [Protopolystoma xenopodis]|uniref:Uncharacterized protein n=1 Tax=Protopolystoma xenopodis TaxID=117903 RepID=A0A3S5CLM0_9PLAT|nr:unnamed protein product [Protopolystoma xenopodis]
MSVSVGSSLAEADAAEQRCWPPERRESRRLNGPSSAGTTARRIKRDRRARHKRRQTKIASQVGGGHTVEKTQLIVVSADDDINGDGDGDLNEEEEGDGDDSDDEDGDGNGEEEEEGDEEEDEEEEEEEEEDEEAEEEEEDEEEEESEGECEGEWEASGSTVVNLASGASNRIAEAGRRRKSGEFVEEDGEPASVAGDEVAGGLFASAKKRKKRRRHRLVLDPFQLLSLSLSLFSS